MLETKSLLLREFAKERFCGIGCAYSDTSDRIMTEHDGFADKENNIPVNDNTIFPACSISKFITALCVMKAYEQNITDIDMPANNFLDRWKLRTSDGNESDASIRSLLCHMAGVIDGEDAFYGLRRDHPVISLTDILDGMTSYNNKPAYSEKTSGTEFDYSDAGYCILQIMLEDITKMPFENIAKEYIFDPLDLKHTFFASPQNIADHEKDHAMAVGYDENGIPIPGNYPQIPNLAASGLWITPKELLIVAKEFVNAYNGRSTVLSEKSAREIAKPADKASWVGIGVFMGNENEIISRGWGENGQSMLKINYISGETAVVMTNQNPGSKDL